MAYFFALAVQSQSHPYCKARPVFVIMQLSFYCIKGNVFSSRKFPFAEVNETITETFTTPLL